MLTGPGGTNRAGRHGPVPSRLMHPGSFGFSMCSTAKWCILVGVPAYYIARETSPNPARNAVEHAYTAESDRTLCRLPLSRLNQTEATFMPLLDPSCSTCRSHILARLRDPE